MSSGFANTNALHAAVVARTLARRGVVEAVISPGSRSTPLTHALVAEPALTCTPVLDERTAGFFAVGLAKASGRPAVLLCTSGTAAANYLPAVIEARLSGTPLLVITADRPHEMRDCASGQTIDQVKLFGHFPVWQAELATPGCDVAATLAHWRQAFAHAVDRAMEARGPVHLNLPFRDPLAPDEPQAGFAAPAGFDLDAFCADEAFDALGFEDAAGLAAALNFAGRFEKLLVVVGAGDSTRPELLLAGIHRLGRGERPVVLADALASLRGLRDDALVTTYDLILRDDGRAAALRPDAVIRIGQPPTSKVLRRRLAEWDVPTLVISPGGENLDPLHRRAHTLRTDPARWCDAHPHFALEQSPPAAYARLWQPHQAATAAALTRALAGAAALHEPAVTVALAAHLPAGTPLVVANSMPVRDTETWMPPGAHTHPVFHNRGANGIDGTLGTALGVASGLARHTVLLTGDLSLLHDTNAFLLASRLRAPLTVVLVNNHGGGIFNHLAVARNPAFEAFWATPQTVDFAGLAAAYAGVTHAHLPDLAALRLALAAPHTAGIRILEITTDRAADTAFRRATYEAIGRDTR